MSRSEPVLSGKIHQALLHLPDALQPTGDGLQPLMGLCLRGLILLDWQVPFDAYHMPLQHAHAAAGFETQLIQGLQDPQNVRTTVLL